MSRAVQSLKSETLSTRVSPEFKWAVELITREHRRSMSGAVEWAVKVAHPEIYSLAVSTYDPDGFQRARALAESRPDLLTFKEKIELRDGGITE